MAQPSSTPLERPSALSLATFRSGQILDWPGADKVALIVLTPLPALVLAALRIASLLGNPRLEPYVDRHYLVIVQAVLVANLVFAAGFAVVWRSIRERAPEHAVFAGLSLGVWLTSLAVGSYLLGPVSTPIFGGFLAVLCALVLFFEKRLARRLVGYGLATYFAPLVLAALDVIPYGPVFRDAPFAAGNTSVAWLLSTTVFAFVIAIVPAVLLFGVVDRWRARDAALLDMARLDPLTRVSNRRYFFDRLGVELERARRHRTKLAVMLLDLDHFKRVNDKHGHLVGDAALVHVARLLEADILRRIDVVSRYGGEEFAVLLTDTDLEGAKVVAERCRAAVAREACPLGGGRGLRLTTSIGVAVPTTDFDADHLMQRADDALYAAKAEGRDRVVIAPDERDVADSSEHSLIRASEGTLPPAEALAVH